MMMMMMRTKRENSTLDMEIMVYPAQSQTSAMALWL